EQTATQSAVAPGSTNGGGTPQYDGTYFFGGAGMDGEYIDDMAAAMGEAGISDVHTVDSERWSMNSGIDAAIGVLALNEEVDLGNRVHTTPERLINKGDGEGQFNLVGYSYGSLVAAQVAMTRVKKGGNVDNLVLIGAPIAKSFLTTLRATKGIRNVIVKDLTRHGDPIRAGMSGWDVIRSAPQLGYQMTQGSGHFYYAPSNQTGMNRRRQLAKDLYDGGLR
ncbi:hypothetical protein ACFO4O_16590, partial [Glaciecola siphonariae]